MAKMIKLPKKENSTVEFKSSFGDETIESLVAFANTKGGKVLIGVANNGSPVKSFAIKEESIQQWLNEIKNKTQPAIIPNAEVIKYKNSKVIEFSVQEFPVKPVAFRGRYFKRVKNSNHQLSAIEISDMSMQTLQVSWDSYSAYARNKLITEAFYLTGDIEKYGSGFLRIRNAISSYPTMKMDFKEIGGGFMVTVSYTEQKTNTNAPENVPENRLTAIINLIKDNAEISMLDLSKTLNVNHKTIKRDMQILKAKGLLERIGSDKGGYWKVAGRKK